jgi:hypothetical protein
MDAAGQLAQLGERRGQLVGKRLDRLRQLGLVPEARAQLPQLERERDQLLLSAVVEVALDLAAGFGGRLDDPAA